MRGGQLPDGLPAWRAWLIYQNTMTSSLFSVPEPITAPGSTVTSTKTYTPRSLAASLSEL